MVNLSVNINKIATLRNARGENNPDVLLAALNIEKYGAHGITVHPRPDGRHIRHDDVYQLKKNIKVELNIEGYPGADYIKLVNDVRPTQATLVPDGPDVLTSDAGWIVSKNSDLLKTVIGGLSPSGARISVFVDPKTTTIKDLKILKEMGVDRVELYTKKYADDFSKGLGEESLLAYKKCASDATNCGLKINAGHDLNLANLNYFAQSIPELAEVSIGHALICDALYFGLQETIQMYLKKIS